MAKDRIYETDDGVRIAPLSALNDFEVAEGYPDIRGWTVASTDGTEVGKVHDLLIDVDQMRTRYLDVRLDEGARRVAGRPRRARADRHGAGGRGEGRGARAAHRGAVRAAAAVRHGRLTRVHELEVRRHFSLGEAAAAAAAGTAATTAARDFYDDEGYDDRRFFGKRRRTRQRRRPRRGAWMRSASRRRGSMPTGHGWTPSERRARRACRGGARGRRAGHSRQRQRDPRPGGARGRRGAEAR